MIFTASSVQMHGDGQSRVPRCWSLWEYPVGGYEVQFWSKPLPKGDVALFVLNTNATHEKAVSISLAEVFGVRGDDPDASNLENIKVSVRDIWEHSDNGTAAGSLRATVGPADSSFYRLTRLA